MKPQTVYIPVKCSDELPECDSQHNLTFLSKTVAILTDEGLNATEYYHKIDNSHKLVDKGWNHQGDFNEITHWLKEETNKYVLSKEEIEKVISDAFEAGANREYQERNYERRDYVAPTKEQYINSIL